MGKAVLRLDALICLVVSVVAPLMAIVSFADGEVSEGWYWTGGWVACLIYTCVLLWEWGRER